MIFYFVFNCNSHYKLISSTLLRASSNYWRKPAMVFSSRAFRYVISFLRELLSTIIEAMVSSCIVILR